MSSHVSGVSVDKCFLPLVTRGLTGSTRHNRDILKYREQARLVCVSLSSCTIIFVAATSLEVFTQLVCFSTKKCKQYTVRAHVFSCAQESAFVVRVSCPVVVITGTHSRTRVAQGPNGSRLERIFVSCPKNVTSHRAMSYFTPHLSITPTPGTCTPSLTRPTSFSSDPLLGELQPCADLRQVERLFIGGTPIPHRS